jgi:hypothetical protein
MAECRLAHAEEAGGAGDVARLVNGAEDRQEVEIDAGKVARGAIDAS